MEKINKLMLIIPIIILCLFPNILISEEEDNFSDCPKYIGDLNKRGNVRNVTEAFDLLLNQEDDNKDFIVSTSFLKEQNKPSDFYAPWKANDNDKNTAWVEGKKGDGITERLFYEIVKVDRIYFNNLKIKIDIINGFAQSKELFFLNSRLKNIKLTLFSANFDICGGYYSKRINNLLKIKSQNFELKDSLNLQEIKFELNKDDIYKIKKEGPVFIILEVEILSVYKGNKYDDTCISEFNIKDIIEE